MKLEFLTSFRISSLVDLRFFPTLTNNVLYIDETTHPLTYSPQKSDGKTRYASYIYYGPNNTKANLSTIKDAATREILAYKVSKNLYIYIYFVLDTVNQLIQEHGDLLTSKTLIHSDQGCHYTSIAY